MVRKSRIFNSRYDFKLRVTFQKDENLHSSLTSINQIPCITIIFSLNKRTIKIILLNLRVEWRQNGSRLDENLPSIGIHVSSEFNTQILIKITKQLNANAR